MAANFTSKLADWQTRHRRAVPAALIAAALVYEAAVKRALTGGYTSGEYVTGRVRNSVTHSEPADEGGAWVIRVGSNLPYALYWEVGHYNGFTNRYERAEKWMPALLDSRDAVAAKFAAVYTRMMGGASGVSVEAGGIASVLPDGDA